MPISPAYPYVFEDLLSADGTSYRGGYCSTADVKLLFINASNFGPVTNNPQLIETVIADTAQDVDRVLDVAYSVPITGTNSIQYLNFINKHMAAASLCNLLAINATGDPEHHLKAAVVHQETGSQRLDDVLRGVTQLFDAQVRAGGQKPAFPEGGAAAWNTDLDPNLPMPDPQQTGPIFGVRDEPAFVDDDWLY